jgi:hypothetical protein
MNAAALMLLLTLAPAQHSPRPAATRPHTTEPHTFGLGGTLSVSNRGAGGSMRYWISNHVGLDLNMVWNRGLKYNSTPITNSTFIAAPSMIVLFGKADSTRDVNIRPFVGAGLTYMRGGLPYQPISTSTAQRAGGTGEQAFAGVEMTFREWPKVALSAEGAYYHLPARSTTGAVIDGVNYFILFHYYLK